MRTFFADAFYYLALLNPDDEAHERAIVVSRELRGAQLTTTWVLTEVADALAAPQQRHVFSALLSRLEASPTVTILPPNYELFKEGVALYSSRYDKEWSLTDCISFVAMRDKGITEALTGDHHFEQAGFTALLK